jgi:hypothetical protein
MEKREGKWEWRGRTGGAVREEGTSFFAFRFFSVTIVTLGIDPVGLKNSCIYLDLSYSGLVSSFRSAPIYGHVTILQMRQRTKSEMRYAFGSNFIFWVFQSIIMIRYTPVYSSIPRIFDFVFLITSGSGLTLNPLPGFGTEWDIRSDSSPIRQCGFVYAV